MQTPRCGSTLDAGGKERSAMADGDVHTVWRVDRWYNTVEGSRGRLAHSATTKVAAVKVGRRMTEASGAAHVIHARSGLVQKRVFYGTGFRLAG